MNPSLIPRISLAPLQHLRPLRLSVCAIEEEQLFGAGRGKSQELAWLKQVGISQLRIGRGDAGPR